MRFLRLSQAMNVLKYDDSKPGEQVQQIIVHASLVLWG
jgi:hypothetical protein